MYRKTRARAVAKAVSWRVVGTFATSALVFLFTRKVLLALAVGGLDLVGKTILFWLHELVWDGARLGKEEMQPAVLWFTGLPGSGKSTLSRWVADQLRARGLRVEQLDGDVLRLIFPDTGFSRAEREAHIKRVGYLASKLEQNGIFVVASFVSPYEASRQFVRGLCLNFIEIHVATPLEVCERRDEKGLYARARRGEIKNLTGIGDPYEPPSNPELIVDTAELTVEQAGTRVLHLLRRRIKGARAG